jgi:hypothetical protein
MSTGPECANEILEGLKLRGLPRPTEAQVRFTTQRIRVARATEMLEAGDYYRRVGKSGSWKRAVVSLLADLMHFARSRGIKMDLTAVAGAAQDVFAQEVSSSGARPADRAGGNERPEVKAVEVNRGLYRFEEVSRGQ